MITVIAVISFNILIGIVFLDYSPALGVLISKYKLDKYSKAIYGKEILSKGLPKYNILDGEYNYKLVTANNDIVARLSYEVIKNRIRDSNFIVKFDIEREIEIIDLELGEDIYLPQPLVVYWIDGNQDFSEYPLKRMDRIYLLGIRNINVELTPDESKEKFFNIVSHIYDSLGSSYNFTSSQIIYTDINGTLETDISAKESRMPYNKLKLNIKKYKQEPEISMKFINQLKDVKDGKLEKDRIQIQNFP